mmetsp:Transcript_24271/g.95536  ORF Transcript_24271/g.95536 Transcript_24271/m.95536 type:complete len:81 (-) Transcript_24271:560-802(-)
MSSIRERCQRLKATARFVLNNHGASSCRSIKAMSVVVHFLSTEASEDANSGSQLGSIGGENSKKREWERALRTVSTFPPP